MVENHQHNFHYNMSFCAAFCSCGKIITDKQRFLEEKKMSDSNWLSKEGYSTYSIGGRDTDISGIGYTLRSLIKQAFPMNEVPESVVRNLTILQSSLEIAEKQIQDLLLLVTSELQDMSEDSTPQNV